MTKTCVGCKYYIKSGDFHVYARVGYRCFVCANKGSDYYAALLNIDEDGNNTNDIWPRCDKWTGKRPDTIDWLKVTYDRAEGKSV